MTERLASDHVFEHLRTEIGVTNSDSILTLDLIFRMQPVPWNKTILQRYTKFFNKIIPLLKINNSVDLNSIYKSIQFRSKQINKAKNQTNFDYTIGLHTQGLREIMTSSYIHYVLLFQEVLAFWTIHYGQKCAFNWCKIK